MSNSNQYDFVIFGATGFTGKLVVEYAINKYGCNDDISWAIAGRNKEKLEKVKDRFNLPSDIAMMIVDSSDQASVDAMVSQTRCVLTTVGPYQLYGEKIITSCISSGTDYVDLCGEPGFMHKIISEYSDEAKQKGARIVFSCGFDSIPFDLGVLFVQEEV